MNEEFDRIENRFFEYAISSLAFTAMLKQQYDAVCSFLYKNLSEKIKMQSNALYLI